MYGALGGKGLGAFHDIPKLTMFADYRVRGYRVALSMGVSEQGEEGGVLHVHSSPCSPTMGCVQLGEWGLRTGAMEAGGGVACVWCV